MMKTARQSDIRCTRRNPLNVLTESPDSGYLRYLILTMFLLSLPEM